MALNEIELEEIPQVREVAPTLPPEVRQRLYGRLREEHARLHREGMPESFADALRELVREWAQDPYSLKLGAICLLVADLIDQGWQFELGADRVSLKPPGLEPDPNLTPEQIKERIRRSLRAGRDRQLEVPSVRQFIRRMERSFRRAEGRYSVLDLIDDGRANWSAGF